MASARFVALVTGGRRGIGRAAALALADAGFDVAVTDLGAAATATGILDELRAHGARALYVASDVGELAGHEAALDAVEAGLGPIDCLVSNAGIGSPRRGDLLDLTPGSFAQVLGVNLAGAFFLTQAVARRMLAAPSAHPRSIVFVSSVSAELASIERGDYCISKAGLAMAARLFALRLASHGIGVFEVRPGIIRTDMTAGVADRYDRAIEGGLVPMRRWGEGADVAAVIAALATGRLAFATGSVVTADGGLSIPRL